MKKFTTYEEQIEILKSRNLKITDESNLVEKLQSFGYYNLINGYSFIFKKQSEEWYANDASDSDILALYSFDKALRDTVYKFALIIESHVKSVVSYTFSKYHGEIESNYLLRECFDKDTNKDDNVNKLIQECKDIITDSSSNNSTKKFKPYIYHYVSKHGHVPLWVLIRAMTIGNISVFYANMKLNEKEEVAKCFQLSPSELEIMLKLLVKFRNTVAHDERIFCVGLSSVKNFHSVKVQRIIKDKLPYNLPIYDIMKIYKNNTGAPLVGTNDFLALMIIFKYLLSEREFRLFWNEFILARSELTKNLKPHFVSMINNLMGLKNKWKNIENIKKEKICTLKKI